MITKNNKVTPAIAEKICADVDDKIYLIKKRIQLKYGLTWVKARDHVNKSILDLYEQKQ